MPTRQVRTVKDDFGGGSFLAVAPELIPANGVAKIENGLLNIDGTVYKRGGVDYKSNAAVGTSGIGLWDGYLGSTRYTFYAATNQFGYLQTANDATPVSLGSSGLTAPAPMVAFGNKLYIGGGKTFDGASMATLGGSFQSAYYAVCANRLCWVVAPNKVRFSEVDNAASFTNRFSTANEHTLPDGVQIIGLATIGANLLIFTTKGIWILYGLAFDIVDAAGNNQHRLQPYSKDVILWEQTGITQWESLLIVPSTNGIYLVDGQSAPVRLSASVDPYYQSYVGSSYHCGQATVYNSHYFLPILRDTTNQNVELFVGRLDRSSLDRRRRASFPWTFFYGAGANVAALAVRVSGTLRLPTLLGIEALPTARITNCSPFFAPDAAHKDDADGSIPAFHVILRDEVLNGLGEGVVRKMRANYILLDAQADAPTILLDEGEGESPATGPRWGDPAGVWGTGFGPSTRPPSNTRWPWSAGDFQEWTTVVGSNGTAKGAPAGNGVLPFSWRLHGRSRKRRFRLRQDTPSANCTIKSLELFVRPSTDVRRAR